MPRADRYFLHAQVWHITHRCHKREFLLKFARDRQRWLGWKPRERYGLIDQNRLIDLAGVSNRKNLKQIHSEWVEEKLKNGNPIREDLWTESLAVGEEAFVKEIRDALGVKLAGRSAAMVNKSNSVMPNCLTVSILTPKRTV